MNGSNLASRIHFSRLEFAGQVQINKMLPLKQYSLKSGRNIPAILTSGCWILYYSEPGEILAAVPDLGFRTEDAGVIGLSLLSRRLERWVVS